MADSLYILDGHAQIYRAYHAVTGLTSPTGEPTNATFGFCAMLLKLVLARKPSHVILTMDAGMDARLALDANYKVQRKPMPEDMPPQIDRISQIVETAGIPIYRHEGCEADDVIATLVRKIRGDAAHAGTMLYMCTKDKDLDQLIDDRVRMYDIQTNEEMDAAGLRAKKGYGPEQARDVLALTGDTVDNIPGIPGVGPKTAAKWLAQYGAIDNLIAHKDEITGKIGEAFRANLHVLAQSRKLVELMFDIPVEMDWPAATLRAEKFAALAPLFRELGFNRMLETLQQVVDTARSQARPSAAAGGPASGMARPGHSATPPAAPAKTTPTAKTPAKPPMPGGLFAGLDDGTSEAPSDSAASDNTPREETENESAAAPALSPTSVLAPVVGDYRLVNTPETLDAMLHELHEALQSPVESAPSSAESHSALSTQPSALPLLSVDTETDALGAMSSQLCGISLCAKEGLAYYIAIKGAGPTIDPDLLRAKLGPLLADPAVHKVGQNLKYDINSLRVFGLELHGLYLDTMVASYVLDSSRLSHGMDALAADLLGLRPIPISDLIGKGARAISFADVPLDRATEYAAEDADVTLRLAHALLPRLQKEKLIDLCLNVEMPLVQVLADMEWHGVSIDAALLAQMSRELADKLLDLSGRIRVAAGIDFNHDSPRQLADVLFKQLKLPVIRKNKTGPSTDIDTLEELSDKHPVPALIVEYRQLAKLKSTYLDTLAKQVTPRTGRVHASFNQTVAATGRLSSSDPNLQNIPIKTEIGRQIRRAFIPADTQHVLLTADYSQIELRMLAHYCRDPALVKAFAEDQDVHRVVAAEIFSVALDQVSTEQRGIAKTVNFGIIYGQTGFGLSKVLRIPQGQANEFISAYKKRFPHIDRFSQECIKEAAVKGYVETILGRRRLIPDINSPIQARRNFAHRAALNSVIQGSAADLIKLAMVRIQEKLNISSPALHLTTLAPLLATPQRGVFGPAISEDKPRHDAKLIMQIHDELVFEVHKDNIEPLETIVRQEMQHAMELHVPLKVDIDWGSNWLEGK